MAHSICKWIVQFNWVWTLISERWFDKINIYESIYSVPFERQHTSKKETKKNSRKRIFIRKFFGWKGVIAMFNMNFFFIMILGKKTYTILSLVTCLLAIQYIWHRLDINSEPSTLWFIHLKLTFRLKRPTTFSSIWWNFLWNYENRGYFDFDTKKFLFQI